METKTSPNFADRSMNKEVFLLWLLITTFCYYQISGLTYNCTPDDKLYGKDVITPL